MAFGISRAFLLVFDLYRYGGLVPDFASTFPPSTLACLVPIGELSFRSIFETSKFADSYYLLSRIGVHIASAYFLS
jgi:hypothetical protein